MTCVRSYATSPTVAPTTAPNEPSGWTPAFSRARWSRIGRRDGSTVGVDGRLHLWPLRVGGEREHEHAGAVRRRGVDQRLQRAEPEERARGHRVAGERGRRVEIGSGVRLRGGAEVATLGVHDHQGRRRAGVRDHRLQDCDAPAAEALEEGGVGLEDGHPTGERVDDPPGEASQAAGILLQAPAGQQGGMRVDARRRAARAPASRRAAAPQRVPSALGPRVLPVADLRDQDTVRRRLRDDTVDPVGVTHRVGQALEAALPQGLVRAPARPEQPPTGR